jgi:hypothetical protein
MSLRSGTSNKEDSSSDSLVVEYQLLAHIIAHKKERMNLNIEETNGPRTVTAVWPIHMRPSLPRRRRRQLVGLAILGLALIVDRTEGLALGRVRGSLRTTSSSSRLDQPPLTTTTTTTSDLQCTPSGEAAATTTTTTPTRTSDDDRIARSTTSTDTGSTRGVTQTHRQPHHHSHADIMNLANYEEHEKKEMEWLLRMTTALLRREDHAYDNDVNHEVNVNVDNDVDNDDHDNDVDIDDTWPQQQTKSEIRRVHLLMKAWARRCGKKGSHAPRVVERILQLLVQERDNGNDNIVIDTKTYNILLDAWSQSSLEGSAERAEQILSEMETLWLSGNADLRPNESSYNACIKAFVKSGSNRLDSVTKAQAILDRMTFDTIAPNRRGYNLLLYALANSNSSRGDAAERADKILRTMLAAYRRGDENVKPDINSYNQVISSWARGTSAGFEYRMQSVLDELLKHAVQMNIQPNADTFNTVMGGWLKSNKPEAQERIEDTLEKMQKSFASGNEDAKPDRVSINTVIAAFCKNGGTSAVERAMEMRDSMESQYSIKRDTVSNNILVDSWCKSRRPDAPERVVELLDGMERDYKKGNTRLKPDAYTYSSVIDSFTKCGRVDAGERAEEILVRMKYLYRNYSGDAAVTSVYNAGEIYLIGFVGLVFSLHVTFAPCTIAYVGCTRRKLTNAYFCLPLCPTSCSH